MKIMARIGAIFARYIECERAELPRINNWSLCGAQAFAPLGDLTMDFAFLTAVGPILALTVGSFLLAFIAEFFTDSPTLSDFLLKD
jgi:hypothetical protein